MKRHKYLALLGLAAALLLVLGAGAADDKAQPAGHHDAAFEACAKACNDCQRECDSCAHHCSLRVADGKKEHLKTLGTCTDCAEICSAAARITAHMGPMSATICDACAKACDSCGEACGTFKEDEHMQRCAKACETCAKACREMIKHAAHATEK
jgi:hypothetical protein